MCVLFFFQEKSKEVLISYLVYIKSEFEKDEAIISMSQLRPLARVATNNGFKNPEKDYVHFSKRYGNETDLQNLFPGEI